MFKMNVEVSKKVEYQAPEVEIVRLQSSQFLLQSPPPGQGGGGMPGGISGENIF